MKRRIVSLLVVALAIPSAFAIQANPVPAVQAGPNLFYTVPNANHAFAVSVQGGIGYADGMAKEFVYNNKDGSKVSQLDWDIQNVLMGGGTLSLRFLDRLTLNGSAWFAISEGDGSMDDYDWMAVGYDEWSDHSWHDVDVTDGTSYDINIAWDLLQYKGMALRIFGGYSEDDWQWDDHFRGALYSSDNWHDTSIVGDGEKSISYEQQIRLPYLGAAIDFTMDALSCSIYGRFSQWGEAEDWDTHFARQTDFYETFDDVEMYAFGARIRYAFSCAFYLEAAADWQSVDAGKGDAYSFSFEDGDGYAKDSAGLENNLLTGTLALGYTF